VHCMAGQDRTGLICALLLDLVGVDRETIGADYAMSGECLRPRIEEWLRDFPPLERESTLEKISPRAEVMLEVLERLHERYGRTEAFLLQAGVAPEDIFRLRERLLPSARKNPKELPLV
jgi:protein-tyrosine phosphatase